MLTLPPTVRVFMSVLPTDMRRGFDRLAAMVHEIIGQDPLSGHLFVFFNRAHTRVKVLAWDRSGYWMWYKRLEAGVFTLPKANGSSLELGSAELSLILEGIDLAGAKRQKRYAREFIRNS